MKYPFIKRKTVIVIKIWAILLIVIILYLAFAHASFQFTKVVHEYLGASEYKAPKCEGVPENIQLQTPLRHIAPMVLKLGN